MSSARNSYEENCGNGGCIFNTVLDFISDKTRYGFFAFFIVIIVASLFGNCAAIISITKRKFRFFQKSCIISLALADIFTTIIIGTNNLETFSHPYTTWSLGEFACLYIPMGQMAGIIATAVILMFIAFDRYKNIVNALNSLFDPGPLFCIGIFVLVGVVSLVLSIPMTTFFELLPLTIVYRNGGSGGRNCSNCTYEKKHTCLSFKKNEMRDYYYAMIVMIFLPLAVVFIWFYYKIASLVWKHRKPIAACQTSSEKIRVERKIRTFKIIIVLMFVFILLRLPYYVIWTIKLSSKNYSWFFYASYIASGLHIVNCALNPLLYTFLNQTICAWKKMKRACKVLLWDICCFFFSHTEFDEFEKKDEGENPFVVENGTNQRNNSRVKFGEDVQEYQNDGVFTKPLKKY